MGRTVEELMTTGVVVVGPDAPVKDAARLMAAAEVSGLPVVDRFGWVIGVVSEADLLVKEARPEELAYRHLFEGSAIAQERTRADGALVAEVMTSPAVTIGPNDSLREAARIMRLRGVKRLPVVSREGSLVGVISRGDVVRLFLRSDAEILREIREDVLMKTMGIEPDSVTVRIRDGVVTLAGVLERRSQLPILAKLAEGVEGVIALRNYLSYERDDSKQPAETSSPDAILSESLGLP